MIGTFIDVKKYGVLDEKAAVKWYTIAAHQGMIIVEDGTGEMVVSPERGKHYFILDTKQDNDGAQHCLTELIFQTPR